MKYLNILIPAAIVIYLAYQLYLDITVNNADNILFPSVLIIFGIAIIVYRIIKLRKNNY